jgi:hypothetical protein
MEAMAAANPLNGAVDRMAPSSARDDAGSSACAGALSEAVGSWLLEAAGSDWLR